MRNATVWRRRLIRLGVIIAAFAVYHVLWNWPEPGEVVVVNSTGLELQEVEVVLLDRDGSAFLIGDPALPHGARLTRTVPSVGMQVQQLRFRIDGVEQEFRSLGTIGSRQTLTVKVHDDLRLTTMHTWRGH